MQAKLSDINKKVSDKYSLDYDLLQSISNTVFKEVANKIRRPKNLIVYLKYIGKMYGRKKKAEDGVLKMKAILNSSPEKINYSKESVKENLDILTFILDRYKEFLNDRNQHKNDSINNTNN